MKRISYTPEDIERDRSGFTARECLPIPGSDL